MKIINTCIVPPFYWINQWLPFVVCCNLHGVDLLAVSIGRSERGSVHAYLRVVVLGFGFCWSWFDRNALARHLALMDQVEAEVKTALQEVEGELGLEGGDDDE